MAVKDLIRTKKCLFICNGSCCAQKDAEQITLSIRKKLKQMGLDDDFHTIRTRCMGRCDDAPVVMVSPDNIWLKNIDINHCDILLHHIQENHIKSTENFLFQMGDLTINSSSIPTKYRE